MILFLLLPSSCAGRGEKNAAAVPEVQAEEPAPNYPLPDFPSGSASEPEGGEEAVAAFLHAISGDYVCPEFTGSVYLSIWQSVYGVWWIRMINENSEYDYLQITQVTADGDHGINRIAQNQYYWLDELNAALTFDRFGEDHSFRLTSSGRTLTCEYAGEYVPRQTEMAVIPDGWFENIELMVVISDVGLNLRLGPGTGYEVLTVMPKRAMIFMRAEYEDPQGSWWALVAYEDLVGWASSSYIYFLDGV